MLTPATSQFNANISNISNLCQHVNYFKALLTPQTFQSFANTSKRCKAMLAPQTFQSHASTSIFEAMLTPQALKCFANTLNISKLCYYFKHF